MTLPDVFTYVLAPLAIGPVLDLIVRPELKTKASGLLVRAGSEIKFSAIHASDALDIYFGKSLFGPTAIARTLIISALSGLLCYILAVATTANGANIIWPFYSRPNFIDIFSIAVVLIFAFVGDILCFAQTRMFIRAAEIYDNPPFILLLLIADAIASITIFILSASVGIAVSFVVVLLFYFPASVPLATTFSPSAVAQSAAALGLEKNLSGPTGKLAAATLEAMKNYDPNQKGSASKIAAAVKAFELRSFSKADADSIEYTATPSCLQGKFDSTGFAIDAYNTYIFTYAQLADIVNSLGKVDTTTSKAQKSVQDSLASDYFPPCGLKVLNVKRSTSVRRWMSNIHPINFYLAATRLAANATIQSATIKFSNYIMLDPYQNMPDFLESAVTESAVHLMGVNNDEAKLNVGNFIKNFHSDDAHYLRLPISPIMLASMISSFLFFAFATCSIISRVANFAHPIVKKVIPFLDIDKSPFAVMGIGCSICSIVILTAISVLQGLWHLVI